MLHCFDEQAIAGFEMGVKTTVCKTCLFHDVSNAGASIAGTTNGARSHAYDSGVAQLFFSRCVWHDAYHIPIQWNVHDDHHISVYSAHEALTRSSPARVAAGSDLH
jgi:hypothetical protein